MTTEGAHGSAQGPLARGLGQRDGLAIVVGGIIGSGIFVAPALIADRAGSPGRALLAWSLAGVLALCGALSFAELSAAVPETGGSYAFLRRAFATPLVAFFFGWTFFFVDGPGSVAALGSVIATYAAVLVPGIGTGTSAARLVAVGCILGAVTANYIGVQTGAGVQRWLTILKVCGLVAIVVVAFAAPGGDWAHLTSPPVVGPEGAPTLSGLGSAMLPALFAFGGWSYAAYVAGEMRDPQRTVPRALLGGIGIVLAIYCLINIAFLFALPFEQLRHSARVATDVVERVLPGRGAAVVAAAVIVSCLGALNAIVLSYARIAFAMARDSLFFRRLGEVHPRFGTPAAALSVQGLVAAAFALSGDLEEILGYFGFVEYLFFSLAVASVFLLRRREPHLHRPHRVWAYPWPPVLFLLVSGGYLTSLLIAETRGSFVGILLMCSGLPFYLWWRRAPLARGHAR
jgi:APA family basic amino acid/polyamine antiporter